ncbi:MAG: alpha/beta hydrolase fold domain-containing protein [Planctomycetota bacterium]
MPRANLGGRGFAWPRAAAVLLSLAGGSAAPADAQGPAPGPDLCVSPAGPFPTLESARDAVRKKKAEGALPARPFVVEVAGGTYVREGPFELGPEDSGREGVPIVYRARAGEEVRISGGRVVRGFQPASDPEVLERLDPAVRGKVLQADLRANGISNLGGIASDRLEVFVRDAPMTLARWPDEGFAKIADVAVKDGHSIHGREGSKVGKFVYEGDRPARWTGEKDPWAHGYWFWDWSDGRERIASIDPASKTISLGGPPHHYGYRKGQWYYAFNLLSELDRPGEWYLDRESGILYLYPPGEIRDGDVVVSVAPSLLEVRGAAHVGIEGFVFEACRGTAASIRDCESVRIARATFRNLGGAAVRVEGGRGVEIRASEIYATGEGAIALRGGDRKSLAPAGHAARENHIHHYGRWNRMYTPAVSLDGVGCRAVGNWIHDAPHQAIAFSGNDHAIEENEIHDVCTESNDAGAIYSGRDWTWRGTVIRGNYLHDIRGFEGRGCVGVYLDDMLSGTAIERNVFRRVTRAAFIGGGRDTRIEENVFVDCDPAVHVDARALGWASYHAEAWIREGREKGTLSGTRYAEPPFDRYPGLARILDEEPAAPRGNVIARNVCVGGRWDEVEPAARPCVRWEDNVLLADRGFAGPGRWGDGSRVSAGEWIALWPGEPPGETGDVGEERDSSGPDAPRIAGRPVVRLAGVSRPAIRVFRPAPEKATGAAVVVCPGGAYHILALDLEGTEVCEWLSSLGVTGILLKYRVPARKGRERYAAALEDVQRAIGIARHRAEEFGIDPGRIGVLGFSAGGHLSVLASTKYERRAYERVDAADEESCRPDFAILVYPAYLAAGKDEARTAPEIEVTAKTPPTFIAGTAVDGVTLESCLFYYLALARAQVPVEMHLYAEGPHGYGLRPSPHAVSSWPERAAEWLRRLGRR